MDKITEQQPVSRVDMSDPEHVAWRDQIDAACREHEAQQKPKRRLWFSLGG